MNGPQGDRRRRAVPNELWAALVVSLVLATTGSQALGAPLVAGLGGPRDFGEQAVVRSDDGSSTAIDITPLFGAAGLNFFGASYTTLYVNTNGNLTFGAPLQDFTPFGIPGSMLPIVAAFFADVDTRGAIDPAGSNVVYYDLDPSARTFTATWDLVGYFAGHTDKRNSFQIRLIDRGAGDFDIEWRYAQLQWTTGDGSGGSGGLGGTPARAGYAKGDGTTFNEFAESGDQALMLDLVNRSNVREAGRFVSTVRGGQVIFCGNGELEAGEECDPTAPTFSCAVGEACRADCTCGPCGNNLVEGSEECDGTADTACPGRCIGATLAGECACRPAFEEACTGDCDRSGSVTVAEVLMCAGIAAGTHPLATCRQCDADGNGIVSTGEVATATAHVVAGCPNLGVCGNGAVENVEECDDGGTCVAGPNADMPCTAAADCPQGSCKVFGGDGCAVNCTAESDVVFDLITGQVVGGTPVPGTSVIETRAGNLVGSPPPIQQAFAFPLNGRLLLTVGKVRSGQRPVTVRAAAVQTAASLDGVHSNACACMRPLIDAARYGTGNSGAGIIDCLGLDGVDVTVSATAAQATTVGRVGSGSPGSGRLSLDAELAVVFGQCFGVGESWGADGQFCTDDDGPPNLRTRTTVELTTGTATASASPQSGQGIGPFSSAGSPFDCPDVAAGQSSSTALAAAAALVAGGPLPIPFVGTVVSGVLVSGPSTCGNGMLDAGEECDDGNTLNGDCCSSTCALDMFCTDGNPCTDVDTCNGLTCVPGAPTDCSDGNVCTADSCDPIGVPWCVHTPVPGPCDDGNPCTSADACTAGTCGGTAVDCTDSDPCTAEKCDPTQGCVYPATGCNDGNPCTQDTCDPASGCVFTPEPAGQRCEDGLFCNGVDTCNGAGQCDHKGDPCLQTQCSFCRERTSKAPGFCNTPVGTRCTDEGDPSTAADKCDGLGACHGQIPATVFSIIAPLAPAPRATLLAGSGADVSGNVCVENLDGRRGARIGGDGIVAPPAGVAARFSGAKIDQNLITGGAEYRGRVTVGGRKDTTGTAVELADCLHARSDTPARVAALDGTPALLSLPPQRVRGGTAITIPVGGAPSGGDFVVDIRGDLVVGPEATLQLNGGGGTSRVIVRVKGRMSLDPGATIKGEDATLLPSQILFIVDGAVSVRRGALVGGSVVAKQDIRVLGGGKIDGQVVGGADVKLYHKALVTGASFRGW